MCYHLNYNVPPFEKHIGVWKNVIGRILKVSMYVRHYSYVGFIDF